MQPITNADYSFSFNIRSLQAGIQNAPSSVSVYVYPPRGPHKWAREMAIPRYLSYPVSGGIAAPPCLRDTEAWSSRLGVGREADLTV
jgi:hypothetical protein